MIYHRNAERLLVLGRPFSSLYGSLMRLRATLYEKNILKARRLPIPVISVGNLSLGGTGKTPHVIEICRFLRKKGVHPAVLTRGYGGKAGSGPLLVSDGEAIRTTVNRAGDEPWMMASKLEGIPVVAGSDRYKCGLLAAEELGVSVLVLDDGFQHLGLKRDLDVVLVEAARPLGSGRVFPGGTLREFPDALSRADAVVITKCNEVPFNEIPLIEETVRSLSNTAPLFRSSYEISNIYHAWTKDTACKGAWEMNDSPGCFCFCGLARPASFYTLLRKKGISISGMLSFPDHHFYSSHDLSRIGNRARETGAGIVLTTEKDFAKIHGGRWPLINRDLGLGVVQVEVKLSPPFYRFIEARLGNIGRSS